MRMIKPYSVRALLVVTTMLVPWQTVRLESKPGANDRVYNIEFILDASGSMNEVAGSAPKIETARQVLGGLVDHLPDEANIQVGLRFYGNQSPKNKHDCQDSKLEIPLGPLQKDAMKSAIAAVTPQGYTPLAYSLEQSLADFPSGSNQINAIILISDGVESCHGDPCKTAEQLKKSDKNITIHVIGFQVGESNNETLQCIPRLTGGFYYDALNPIDLEKALKKALDISLHSGYLVIASAAFMDHCKIFDQTTGSVVKECYTRTEVSLLPGIYRLELPTKPPTVIDNVVIRQGEKNILKPMGKGYLIVNSDGFIKNCKAYNQETNELVVQFYSRTQIELPAGIYKIEIPTNPPDIQENIVVTENSVTKVQLTGTGKLMIQSRAIIANCKVIDPLTGQTIKTIYSKVAVPLPVGTYRIEIPNPPPQPPRTFNNVVIEADKTKVIEAK